MERDFGELHISEEPRSRRAPPAVAPKPQSPFTGNRVLQGQGQRPQYRNGLATFTPVIYPNPADLSSDEDEPPPPPPPLQSYGGGSHYANVDDFPPPPQESSVPTATGIRVTMAPNRPYTATNPTYEVIDNYSAPVANTRNEPFNVPRSRSPYQERVTVERSVPSYNPKPASFSYATSSSRPVFGKVTSQAAQGMNSRSSPVPKPVGSTFIVSSRRMDEPPSAPGVPRPGYSLSEHLSHISPSYRPPESPYALDQTPAPPVARTAETPQYATSIPIRSEGSSSQPPSGKAAEVDALTNLLIQNMEASADPDFFGMCANCGHKVIGETNGCTALDQVYHIECFTCYGCGICLRGQPFFAMEGKPYCEYCYMNTLEKCSVCSTPITDRILRATGKPYHPKCFKCVVCGKSLDGIPFTVDATNQIHCIEDFHKKFAPRCCKCGHPIMPQQGQQETVRIVAMDRSFHTECYTCEDCGLVLSSEADGRGCYPLDDHILCKNCNARRIQAMTTKMTTEL